MSPLRFRPAGRLAALLALAAALAVVAVLTALPGHAASVASAATSDCSMLGGRLPATVGGSAPPLVFGIYSGGGAGTTTGTGRTNPIDPVKRLGALQALRAPGLPFVVHLYTSYTGDAAADAKAPWIADEIAQETAAGLGVEIVLTYRPQDRNAATDVPGFADFTRRMVRAWGTNPNVVSIQVTNEANIPGQPDASDGDFPGVRDALVQGVIAGAAARDAIGAGQLKIGFNWAYTANTNDGRSFFADLSARGGAAFRSAVDWVGIDMYPGTWTALASGFDSSAAVRGSVVEALHLLRDCDMPAGGLGDGVQIHVSESGYPTGPDRTTAEQLSSMRSQVAAVDDYRANYNVTDYRWFDLRDADSSGGMESQYGILYDDYSPKPAFAAYHDLIATRGAETAVPAAQTRAVADTGTTAAAPATCKATSVTIRLGRSSTRRMHSLTVLASGKVVRRVRGNPLPTRVRVRVTGKAATAGRVKVLLRGGRGRKRSVTRAFATCARAASVRA